MSSAKGLDAARSLALLAREINQPRDLDATLQAIVESAQRSMPGIDQVGISIAHRDGTIETRAATGDLVWQLDNLQYGINEGPCVYAIKVEPVVKVEHARHEPRWPRYMPEAVEMGLRAQLGLALYNDASTLGGLNMYSTSSDTIDPEVEELAELFAAHAAVTLGRAQREDQLRTALTSRQLIGQAVGIVMERYGMDETRAFDYLARVSSHSNIKLRDVAQEVVDQTNRRSRDGG
ncbi:GAF and ANTAR domain-containing protein [Marmoricola sp. URHB0036]|uniref:GAF and ANTAR domain-containing protein n=1 Tax=Marmoricola sp. URHB0036 TaxID=1298863 RepID=UPI0004292D02|nr:GAF and ANTAR domain-containing protein [Marmoricola sp. URHB0036]